MHHGGQFLRPFSQILGPYQPDQAEHIGAQEPIGNNKIQSNIKGTSNRKTL